MIDNFLAKLFPDPTEKKVKQYAKKLEVIHAFEKDFSSFSLDDVKTKTAEYKKRFE